MANLHTAHCYHLRMWFDPARWVFSNFLEEQGRGGKGKAKWTKTTVEDFTKGAAALNTTVSTPGALPCYLRQVRTGRRSALEWYGRGFNATEPHDVYLHVRLHERPNSVLLPAAMSALAIAVATVFLGWMSRPLIVNSGLPLCEWVGSFKGFSSSCQGD